MLFCGVAILPESHSRAPFAVIRKAGVAGDLFASIDWTKHPLGPTEAWPAALKISLNIMFHSHAPMFIWWGPELYQFYNDAYLPSFGIGKHPHAMGQKGSECWPETWPIIKSQIDVVMNEGRSTWNEDQLIPIFRNGKLEDVYWTYGYSPIFSEDGTIGGTLVVCKETTKRVVAQKLLDVANEQIKVEREKLLNLFTQAPLPLAMVEGPEHRFIFANATYEKYFLRQNDYIGKKVTEIVPEATSQGFLNLLDNVYKTGKRYVGSEIFFEFVAIDGITKNYYLDFVYEPIRNRLGDVEGILAVISDVTEQVRNRKNLESAIAAADVERTKFATIFTDASTSMAITRGPKHVFENVNPSYFNLFEKREILGRPLLEAFPELIGQHYPALFDQVFQTGEVYTEREAKALLRRTETGPLEERYFDQTYTRILGVDGKPYGVFIHAAEVTERVLVRRRIQENESQLKLATETARLGTWSFNTQTALYNWSERASEIFGLSFTPVITLEQIRQRIHPEDRDIFDGDVVSLLDSIESKEIHREYRIIWPDGRVRWVQSSTKATFTETNDGNKVVKAVGTLLDLTDRLETQIELRNAKDAAEQANAAKSAFLANMSHEIRTPLGAIMGFVDLLKDDNITRQTMKDYLSVIDRNSGQLLRIVDDILDLSKIEAGKMLIENIEFSFLELLSDFSSLMGFRARDKGVNFDIKARTPLPENVISDPTRVKQILLNIVGNAIKFTETGGVVLDISFEEDILEFEIRDTGRGISKDQEQGLFQPFAQADVSITRKFGGTGLGLVLTKHLSEALGGDFVLKESVVGAGSIFVATIKVQIPSGTSMVSALGYTHSNAAEVSMEGKLRGLKLLLVEDSLDNQALISILLAKTGAFVDIVSDGSLGVKAALQGNYDAILMDVQMPVMDGITATKALRIEGYSKPIIALTAHTMREERDRCINAGFSDFLSKPINREALLNLLMRTYKNCRPTELSY